MTRVAFWMVGVALLCGCSEKKPAPTETAGPAKEESNRLEAVGQRSNETDRLLEADDDGPPTVRTDSDLPPPILPPSGSGSRDTGSYRPAPTPVTRNDQPSQPQYTSPPSPSPGEPTPPELPRVRTHVVQPGETFYSIASKYYGSGKFWQKIYQANRKRVPDPAALPVGMKLIIP